MTVPTAHVSRRLQQVLEIDPDQVAIWSGDRTWKWQDLLDTQLGIDEALLRAGVTEPGARVALVMKTTFEAVACQIALLARGHTIFSLSPMMGDERLHSDIARSQAAIVIGDANDWERDGMRRGCEALGASGHLAWPASGGPFADVLHAREDRQPVAVLSPDVANVMLTSGTTGDPKRIPIEYAALDNMLSAVRHYAESTRSAQDRLHLSQRPSLIASPLVHSSGFGGVVRAVAEARPLVLLERFLLPQWVDAVETFKPGTVALPPPALAMILEADVDRQRLASLKAIVVGSAALPLDLEEAFEAKYEIPLLCTYGATEFPGGLAGWTLDEKRAHRDAKRGSVGRVHPGVELRITSEDDGSVLGVGSQGLLDVRTPATSRETRDGWVQTKDIASIDGDGFIYIHGRADDAIIRGGFKVSPQEVEAILESHPSVSAAGVVGRRDARLGEVPVAVVEVTDEVDSATLIAYARERLASYQVPVNVHVVPELPRTPSMKVSKPMLRDWLDQIEREAASTGTEGGGDGPHT